MGPLSGPGTVSQYQRSSCRIIAVETLQAGVSFPFCAFVLCHAALTLLFLSFLNSSAAPIDDWYRDRLTFYTHRRASVRERQDSRHMTMYYPLGALPHSHICTRLHPQFYRTSSYYLAEVMYSAPVALIEAFFLCVISFFAVGMTSQGAGFVYFWILFSLIA